MNVLSLFDGMSGGQIALVDMGATPETYYASEVDKHAIAQTQLNFPSTIHLGDVRNIDVSQLKPIDLLIGGSPCQSFSFAGKRNGMTTKCEVEITRLEQYLELKAEGFAFEGQSYLFWEYIRILTDIRKYNPNVLFLLENVEMGKKWERVLSEAIGIYGVHINSALVSAQNRKRIYWTNIRVKKVGLFGELHSDIPQPADRGILLKDILEKEVDEKYYLSDKMVQSLTDWGERNANNGNGFKPEIKEVDEKSAVLTTGSMKSSSTYVKVDKKLNPKPNQDKASCFTAGGNSGGNHSDMDLICVAMRGRNPDDPSDRTGPTQQRLEPNLNGKTNCLTSVQKDNLVMEQASIKFGRTDEAKRIRRESMKQGTDYTPFAKKEIVDLDFEKMNTLTTAINKDNLVMQINPSTESGGKQPYQQNRVNDDEGISPALCANKADLIVKLNDRQQKNFVAHDEKSNSLLATSYKGNQANGMSITNSGYRIRRLTPLECARLQTIPEWYKWECSDTQAYRMLGNGWTVEVIKHIFSFIPFL